MRIFVFDLDFTLWNAGDTFCSETNPPYLWEDGKLLDRSGRWIRLYPQVMEILDILKKNGCVIAAASRTEVPANASQLLSIFGIEAYFQIKQIFPGSKISHLKNIQKQLACCFDEMIFFDDEERNILDAKSLGIVTVLVKGGLKVKHILPFL
jgi:magnesium-dependent phosphatase 1